MLDRGLRYSLQGGSFEASRDQFTWNTVPSVTDFQDAVEDAFAAWMAVDPASGLGTDLSFVADLATPVVGLSPSLWVHDGGAEIDLLTYEDSITWNTDKSSLRGEAAFAGTGLGTVELTSPAPVSRTTRLWAQISSSTATTKRSGRWATKRGRSSFSGRQQVVAARSGFAGSPSSFLHNSHVSIQ